MDLTGNMTKLVFKIQLQIINNDLKEIIKIILAAVVAVVVLGGTFYVVVLSQNISQDNFSKQIIDECNLDLDCGIDSLLKISKTNDEKIVLDSFHELKSHYQKNVSYCHEYGHHLGMFLYNYYGDYKKALSIADEHVVAPCIMELQKATLLNLKTQI